jgi:hypothetical protein
MLLRVVIISLAVIAGLWFLKRAFSKRSSAKDSQSSADTTAQSKLIQCAHCSARLPATDAVWKDGQAYCSMTHRHLGPKG